MENRKSQHRRNFLQLSGAGLVGAATVSASVSQSAHAVSMSGTYYNVNDYNYGSDQADIQAAIDAATANGGGVVYLPARTYTIQTLRLKKNVTLLGEGPGTLLQHNGSNSPAIATHNSDAFPVGISSLRIKGNGGGNNSHGIYLASTSSGNGFTNPDGQHIVCHVYIENMAGHGIHVRPDCRGSLIEGCWIKACRRGMYIGGSDTTLSNCVSRSNTLQGVFVAGGNVRFMNCKTFFNRNGGFFLNGTRNVLVACEAQDNWNYGFRIARNYATMNGCIADSNQYYGFLVDGTGAYLGGINLTGITAIGRSEVQGNKPWIGQRHGVRLNNTIFNDCSFSGIARDNNRSNYAVAASSLNNCLEQILDGRIAAF